MEKITGACHCGRVKFEIPFDGAFVQPRRCDCSYCSRRWAVMASVKVGDLTVVEGEDCLTLYQWGTFAAKHYFCLKCGIYTHHQRRSNPREFGVNIACFDFVDVRDYANAEFVDGRNHPSDRR